MLIIRRREGEAILIGETIEIEIMEVAGGRVKVGIRAPRDVPILRKEIRISAEQNLAAWRTQSGPSIAQLIREYFPASYSSDPNR